MVKKIFMKYSGVIFFYLMIIIMIIGVNARINYMNSQNDNTIMAYNKN
jgi:hypothetical protein